MLNLQSADGATVAWCKSLARDEDFRSWSTNQALDLYCISWWQLWRYWH